MSFLAHEENGLFIKTSTVLSGVRHGFSTRIGGVSPAPWDSLNLGVGRGDDMDRVRENYRRFCAALGVDEHRAVLSKQVHEDNVRHVTAEDCGKGLFRDRDYTSVDAMVTDTPGIPLVVFSADCGIILLHDPVHGAVGAAHAGWRGAAGGIVYKTVRRMQELFGKLQAENRSLWMQLQQSTVREQELGQRLRRCEEQLDAVLTETRPYREAVRVAPEQVQAFVLGICRRQQEEKRLNRQQRRQRAKGQDR